MKKKAKWTAVSLLIILTVLMNTGCLKKATSENLLTDMAVNMAKVTSMDGTMKMNMDMSVYGVNAGLTMNMNMQSDIKNKLNYLSGTASVGGVGLSTDLDIEMYQQLENQTCNVYSKDSNTEEWSLTSFDIPEEKTFSLSNLGDLTKAISSFEVDKELTTVEGQKCFKLDGVIDGDVVSGILESGILDAIGGSDMIHSDSIADAKVPCTVYIYKDDIRLAKMELDMTEILNSAIVDNLDKSTIDNATYSITIKHYNADLDISIPKDALDAKSGDSSGLLDDVEGEEGKDSQKESSTTIEQGTPSENLGAEWKSGQLQVNDTVLTFPCTIADVEKTGFKMDEEWTPLDTKVEAGDYEIVYFVDAKENEISFNLYNFSESTKMLSECQVSGINLYDYDLENGDATVILPGNIQMGMTKDDLIRAYGEPNADHNFETDESYTWYDGENYNSSINVYLTDGKIVSIYYDINNSGK